MRRRHHMRRQPMASGQLLAFQFEAGVRSGAGHWRQSLPHHELAGRRIHASNVIAPATARQQLLGNRPALFMSRHSRQDLGTQVGRVR